jgi:hypothetical protein
MNATITAHTAKFANQFGYSDIEPFEVIRVISEMTIEIREMDTKRDDSVKMEFVIGGFAGHCTNQRAQKWHITSNDTYPITRIRLSKNGGWKDRHGRRFGLSDTPQKFYDYNF